MLGRAIGDNVRRKRIVVIASLAVLIGIPLAIWLVETWRHHDHLTTRPNTWDLGFQVRLPAGQPTPGGEKIGIELRSEKENPKCSVHDYPHGLTKQGDHFVISGGCPLFYAQPTRTILVRIADQADPDLRCPGAGASRRRGPIGLVTRSTRSMTMPRARSARRAQRKSTKIRYGSAVKSAEKSDYFKFVIAALGDCPLAGSGFPSAT